MGERQKATMGSPMGKWTSPDQKKKYIHPAQNSARFWPAGDALRCAQPNVQISVTSSKLACEEKTKSNDRS
jgi:hypothetical protein